ncbi:MAG: hypothetical protein ACKV2Q_36695 [Planctomycetaceae bacterium]
MRAPNEAEFIGLKIFAAMAQKHYHGNPTVEGNILVELSLRADSDMCKYMNAAVDYLKEITMHYRSNLDEVSKAVDQARGFVDRHRNN